jgi:hypothetical protein
MSVRPDGRPARIKVKAMKKTYLSMFLTTALSMNVLAAPAPFQQSPEEAKKAAAQAQKEEPKGLTPKEKE